MVKELIMTPVLLPSPVLPAEDADVLEPEEIDTLGLVCDVAAEVRSCKERGSVVNK